MVVKFSNSVWEDGLLLPEIMYEAAESIYDDDGTIRAQIRTKIEAFLTKIKLDQIIVATILFGATLDQVRVNLRVFVNRFCSGSNAEILGTPALRSAVSKEGMTPQQVSQALKDIKQAIDDTDNKVKPKSATTRKQLSTLFADQKSRAENKKPGEISYNCRQEYNKLTKLIGRLTARIENARNLWDVILAVLPQGLTQRIYKSQLTETQSRLIDLITVLVPPVEDIWMIKDECLVLERPDTTRQEWEAELEKEISAHKKLVRQVNKTSSTNEKEEQETTLCADLDKVNSTIRESMRLIGEQIGHIPDYMGRLNRGDFTELTPNQLKMVLGIFRQTNDKISSNCSANT
jgi:truncated hemoglobin YjbI